VAKLVGVPDGRKVAVESWGPPTGMPVFLLHGTPGSRSGPRPRASVLYRLGIYLISYDRPGYGESDPHPNRTVADAAGDVRAIADELELDSFGVVGRSGGGPHALACAALLEGRVQRAACLVGLAPSDAKDLDWYAGMTESNVQEYSTADASRQAVQASVAPQAEQIRENPDSSLGLLLPKLSKRDLRVVDDIAIRRLLTDTYAEAVRDGEDGWIDDVVALRRPWDFDLTSIKVPVLLWHGADDEYSPVSHTYWLEGQISTAVVQIQPDTAHFGAVEILPTVLAWMKTARGLEGLRIQGPHKSALLP
jgi:pimeloyl-ACP methyl ester carboxylesterase